MQNPSTPSAKVAPATLTFTGRCDGSAGVSLGGTLFATTSDEVDDATGENTLAVYDAAKGGAPVATLALNATLGLPVKGKKSAREADMEAAATIGERVYWIASHSLSKDGGERPARYQFFATETDGTTLKVVGKPHHNLKRDMLAEKRLATVLAVAATKPPDTVDGWNIEGMSATPDGKLLIGFRSPVVGGRALLVPLENPAQVIDNGAKARFGEPVLLDLGAGRGIRSMAWWAERKCYVILAGLATGNAPGTSYQLFLWDGKATPTPINSVAIHGLNAPETVFVVPGDTGRVMVLSDDGAIDGCKDKPDTERRFLGGWVNVPH